MSFTDDLNSACAAHEVGTVDLKNAHIWFHPAFNGAEPGPILFVFDFLSDEDQHFSALVRNRTAPGGVSYSDTGACMASWKNQSTEQLLMELQERLIELSVNGGSMKQMVCQMAKIKEFAALGADSFPMARALSSALAGKSYENMEFWSQFKA